MHFDKVSFRRWAYLSSECSLSLGVEINKREKTNFWILPKLLKSTVFPSQWQTIEPGLCPFPQACLRHVQCDSVYSCSLQHLSTATERQAPSAASDNIIHRQMDTLIEDVRELVLQQHMENGGCLVWAAQRRISSHALKYPWDPRDKLDTRGNCPQIYSRSWVLTLISNLL